MSLAYLFTEAEAVADEKAEADEEAEAGAGDGGESDFLTTVEDLL